MEDIRIRAPIAGAVEVAVGAVAICHSDISFAAGAWSDDLPAVYGHEAAGRVTAVGPGIRSLTVGDTVVVTLFRACGSCPSCASAMPILCETPADDRIGRLRTSDNGALQQAMHCSAFAEAVVVDQSQVVAIDAVIPKDAACLIACGLITGVGAVVNAAKLRAGQNVVVIGAGGVGLNAIQVRGSPTL